MGLLGSCAEPWFWIAGRLRRTNASSRQNPGTVFVLRSSDLGDLLTTTPLFDALRRKFPRARIIAGIGSWSRAILEENPFIDEIIELDVPWYNKAVLNQSWFARIRFMLSPHVRQLRKRGGFDVGIEVTGSRSGHLFLALIGAKYCVGVRGFRGGWSLCQTYHRFSKNMHVARAALAQAELLGATELPQACPQLFVTARERVEAVRAWGERIGEIRLLVGGGAGLPEKTWPLEEMEATLRSIQGNTIRWNIIIVGGPRDVERGDRLSEVVEATRSLCGTATLRQTFALAEQADIVLSNSSMLIHVAAAFKKPTVTVLGKKIHSDPVEHDLLWGYPRPYRSIAESGAGPSGWPSVGTLVAAIVQEAKTLQGSRAAANSSVA